MCNASYLHTTQMDQIAVVYEMFGLGLYDNSRRLASANAISKNQNQLASLKWKGALWERNSIEPAMLRVPIVLITLIVFWGINIWCMEKARIGYHGVLFVKSVSVAFVFFAAAAFVSAYALSFSLLSALFGFNVETGISIFYMFFVVLCCFPKIPYQDTRLSFFRLLRLLFLPNNTVTFPEILLADALTSLSKVFKDVGVTIVAVYAYFMKRNIVSLHNEGMILVAILASVPFWIRVRQCWIQFENCPDISGKLPITLNIVKYFTAFPPIWLAAAASLGYFHPNLPTITAVMATVNSVLSFLWDVIMDWGIVSLSRNGRVSCRKRAAYPWIFYAFAVVVNLLLRFSWAANRLPGLSRWHASHLVLLVEIAEVARRALWNVIRIEWEVMVQQEKHGAQDDESADKQLVKPMKVAAGGMLQT